MNSLEQELSRFPAPATHSAERHARMPGKKHFVPLSELPLWRRIVSVIGEILITIGIFLLLFCSWEILWTGYEAKGVQQEKVENFTKDWQPSPLHIGTPLYSDPPVEERKKYGETLGMVHLPTLSHSRITIEEGTSLEILNHFVYGHYEDSQQLGELGNFAIAAHREGFGGILMHIDQMHEGDPIIIETEKAYYVYKMTRSYAVTPDQVQVVWPVPGQQDATPTERIITLTTCDPPFIATKRLITHGVLDHWVDRSSGIPEELSYLIEEGK